jgi:broad specificity phosphatase PhoE
MTRFFLLRHGQTVWNKETRFRGRKDVPLSDQGRLEAEALAEALAAEKIDACYASPLSRSMETLRPLAARLGREVVPLPEVVDLDFGEWEGWSLAEAEERRPELFAFWKQSPHLVTFPGGENLAQAQARSMRAISRLARAHPDQTVAVCSHRVICKLIVLGLLGLTPERFWAIRQDTACVNRFEYDPPTAILITLNETHHLNRLGGTLRQDF